MNRALCALVVAVLLVGVTSCAPKGAAERLDALQAQADSFDAELTETEDLAQHLSDRWSDVVVGFETAATAYERVESRYALATSSATEAASVAHDAAARLEQATRRWQFYQGLVQVAAQLDAVSVGSGRSSVSCDNNLSTAAFRRQLEARGVDLAGKDIDHIVPSALGGADNPANYQLLDSSVNRSLQDTWNLDKCLSAGPLACAAAVAVSMACGRYAGPLL